MISRSFSWRPFLIVAYFWGVGIYTTQTTGGVACVWWGRGGNKSAVAAAAAAWWQCQYVCLVVVVEVDFFQGQTFSLCNNILSLFFSFHTHTHARTSWCDVLQLLLSVSVVGIYTRTSRPSLRQRLSGPVVAALNLYTDTFLFKKKNNSRIWVYFILL